MRAYDTISAHNAEGSLFVPPLASLAEVDAMRRHDIAADARARLGASRARAARANAACIIARACRVTRRRCVKLLSEATSAFF